MKTSRTIFQLLLVTGLVVLAGSASMGQKIGRVKAFQNPANDQWEIDVAFTKKPTRGIDAIRLENVNDNESIVLTLIGSADFMYSYTAAKNLELRTGKLELAKRYQVIADVKNNDAGKPNVTLIGDVILIDPNATQSHKEKVEAKSVDPSDVYLSGELNGAHREKTRYSTKIKLQKPFLFDQNRQNWSHRPFFKLNASTDPDADPDKMETGWAVDYIAKSCVIVKSCVFTNAVKLESERDFDNTNFIYDTRLTFLPIARPKGADKRVKVFFNPFLGGEFGKNLKSPLKAAQGDGIARLLAGADIRLAFFLHEDSDEPEINWTTSYERRWLLTDELSFKTDDDGNLVLRTFGKSPRDYVSSKVSYKFSKFFETFLEYEWGQVPPSYKLVDHRFRLGFAYKFKFGVK
jgi:hypothetical protein